MLGEAQKAQDLAQALDERGVFVAGFFFPVVPKGQARIRTQMSAALTEADIDFAIARLCRCGEGAGDRVRELTSRGYPPTSRHYERGTPIRKN